MTANRELIERYLRYYNDKDVEAMVALFTEDAVFESVSNTTGVIQTSNRQELRQLAMTSVEWFEQRRQTVTGWVIDDAHVALEIDYWCRLAKDLPDGKKAGEEMRLRGASFFTIRNGRICRLVDYM
ncbi:MAG: nuclear transport factor 2 family protein [Sedimentisphaerales bacterium]|nr:nuclear transport factor 2 family protein [Sedimentisphaerales bacterium]